MQRLDIIAGARPNFMKIGPIVHAIERFNTTADHKIEYRLIHTGQHYDYELSKVFFDFLSLFKFNEFSFSSSHKINLDKLIIKLVLPKPSGPDIIREFMEFEEMVLNIFSFNSSLKKYVLLNAVLVI